MTSDPKPHTTNFVLVYEVYTSEGYEEVSTSEGIKRFTDPALAKLAGDKVYTFYATASLATRLSL